MKMISVTPLGQYYIDLALQHWNASSNTPHDLALKSSVKECFLSDSAKIMQGGFDILHKLIKIKWGCHPTLLLIAEQLNFNADHFVRESIQKETFALAQRDLAYYFALMFKAGYFECIPKHEFGYILPDAGDDETQTMKTRREMKDVFPLID